MARKRFLNVILVLKIFIARNAKKKRKSRIGFTITIQLNISIPVLYRNVIIFKKLKKKQKGKLLSYEPKKYFQTNVCLNQTFV